MPPFIENNLVYQFFYGIFQGSIAAEMVAVFLKLWFIWLPVLVGYIFIKIWLAWVQNYYIWNNPRTLIEIKIPREFKKPPLSMETFFNSLYEPRKPNYYERFWEGFVPAWYSFEVASIGGELHFYINTPKFFQKLVESHLYSQFPGFEIKEVDDYTRAVPRNIPNQEWEMRAIEFGLEKPDAYPIRTYLAYNLEKEVKSEESIDPLNSLFEFMGSLSKDEQIWMQVLIESADDEWKKKTEELHEMMTGKKRFEFVKELARLTPEEEEIAKAVGKAATKPGFKTGFRIIYLARREAFSPRAFAAVQGIIKQFSSPVMNGFKPIRTTRARYVAKRYREDYRKRMMLDAYRLRSYFHFPYPRPYFIFNTEELATIYHFPATMAEVPTLERLESRKVKPPPYLPV